jgi:hypothetical protein
MSGQRPKFIVYFVTEMNAFYLSGPTLPLFLREILPRLSILLSLCLTIPSWVPLRLESDRKSF